MKLSDGREMTTCELRLGAASVIERVGWCQGDYCNNEGAVCILGAIDRVLYGDTIGLVFDVEAAPEYQLFTAAVKAMRLDWPSMWNDHPGRTVDQVLAKLRDGCVAETAELESATP